MSKNKYANSHILLAEDEETLAIGLEYNLKAEGYRVTWARDGNEAMETFHSDSFDLIILDIMLPFRDGFDIARDIRQECPQMPILMLTARSKIEDRVHGLEIGADDYMTKPFHLEELLARIKGMLRRKQWYTAPLRNKSDLVIGKTHVNFETLTFQKGKKEHALTPHEAMVLRYLVEHEGVIVSRKELLEKVWNIVSDVDTRTVDNFIVRLRKYFEPNPKSPRYFKSVRSAGYMFKRADKDEKSN